MLASIRRLLTRSRLITKLVLVVAVLSIGFGVWGHHQNSAANANLIERLQMLRSTSPESGIADAAIYDVAAADSLISDLQAMSEVCAMAAESPNAELAQGAMDWSQKLEANMAEIQSKRRALVLTRIQSLRSTSPESGIN